MVVPNFDGTPPRLARVVCAVQSTPAWTAIGAGLRGQVMVDAQQ
jgi:hypothetical protein